MKANVESLPFGPQLELDGTRVALTRDPQSRQLFVTVNTEEAVDNDADGNPLLCVDLNGALLYDGEKGRG
jgi:hypothetical protein